MTNKILIVGVLDVPSSTNVAMKRGFEQLGYQVVAYNYRSMLSMLRGSEVSMWTHFCNYVQEDEYKLIVFCKVNQMSPKCIAAASKVAPTWYWFMDPLSTAEAIGAGPYCNQATYCSATASNVVSVFKCINENSFHIIEGFDPELYYYELLPKIYDITFIGNPTQKRAEDILSLSRVIGNKEIHVFGSGWPADLATVATGYPELHNITFYPPVFNEDERRVINQSKIVLNLCHDDIIFSDRVTKSLACGAHILSQMSSDLYEMSIKPEISICFYETTKEACEYIEAQLSNPHNLSAFQKRFFNKVQALSIRKDYSWKSVCERILSKLGAEL